MTIFSPTSKPRVFGLVPGVDFGRALVSGIIEKTAHLAPHERAEVEVYVNTQRMRRRLIELFDELGAALLPRIRLLTDLGNTQTAIEIPAAVPDLRRRLELTQLVARLIDAEPGIAPRAALFDLSDSLARLMDEMEGEGVAAETIRNLDVSDQSGHWARSLNFLSIIQTYTDQARMAPTAEARQRRVIEALIEHWRKSPPEHPVLVAGSTGSRGATALFMDAVSRLPQGAVILPGFDFDLTQDVWNSLSSNLSGEDHPQYRFRKLMVSLGIGRDDIVPWHSQPAACPSRNRLISLSLRPAPVTDQWLTEGPRLDAIEEACDGITLLNAPSPRIEAEAIALGLRQAVAAGKTVAVITPDRMLTRQVAAALDRWHLAPDDSAGQPLHLTPPGRFLRHVADLMGAPITAGRLLALLKHPLTNSGDMRGDHLRFTHELELRLRRHGPPFPAPQDLRNWGRLGSDAPFALVQWADWLAERLEGVATMAGGPLSDLVASHIALAEALARGPQATGSGELWQQAAGRKAMEIAQELTTHAVVAGEVTVSDFQSILGAILSGAEVRNPDTGHPQILFWGTLEARVQGADLVILAGLNEGVWPESPAPDPWLNRRMRDQAALLLPERRIGLSAHDYQQAVAGKEVWITRSIRSDDAPTVPSRWLNRLTNLLEGLADIGGDRALKSMVSRGNDWVHHALRISEPDKAIDAAKRPAPRPPVAARPKELPVTKIKTLVRDPYAIYAERILGLRPLDPLNPEADAPMRGMLVHDLLENFIFHGPAPDAPDARNILMAMADSILATDCPWPTIRKMWRARIDRFADWFLATEVQRRAAATPHLPEASARLPLDSLDFSVTARADRIDVAEDGTAIIYDYKTGTVSTKPQQIHFDKQLLLQAAMAERGAFSGLPATPVSRAAFIGLGGKTAEVDAPFDECSPDQTWDELHDLIRSWLTYDTGYTSRRAVFLDRETGYYDHLARFGEWDQSQDPTPEDLT